VDVGRPGLPPPLLRRRRGRRRRNDAPAGEGPRGDAISSPRSASSLRRLAAACVKSGGGGKNKLGFGCQPVFDQSRMKVGRPILGSMAAMSCALNRPAGEASPRGIPGLGPG
jgi:hypothetical protein